MATSGASSSSSSKWKYDVFLSFCGEDTRTSFTDHLFNALIREGIQTFRDNEELNRGEDISSRLEAAIEDSRVAIIVFSQNYAFSTWCLGELLKILNSKRDGRMEKVLPVFYKIDPSDVRKQSNTYAQAFMRHEQRFQNEKKRVEEWRSALEEAANLSGWDQRKFADGHEAELIKDIVGAVLAITNPAGGCLDVAKFPTGLHSHVEAICGLLNEGRPDAVCGLHKERRKNEDGLDVVRTIGIYGPGGIGKTTIAKAVFNIMSRNFHGSCFLADVREVSSQQQGSLHLQKQLLSDILKREGIEIHNEHRGITMINNHIRCKRVLIVFDDVMKMKHLDKLVGDFDWFCPGSRIILTTRDEHLLTELDVDEKYKYRVETMDVKESLQLLCRHAFRQDHPLEGYEKLSKKVLHYAGGLPLALVTLGSLLYKRSPVEWNCQLKKLKEIPLSDVLEKLKISYDALDKFDQSAFLDISCFFVGKDKDWVSMLLDACYLSGEAVIKNLKERCLVTIGEYNRLHMHDLIRDMGREIVCNESPKNLGGRSRVWKFDEAIDILRNLNGTSTVEGLQLLGTPYREEHEYSDKMIIKGVSKMPNLRFLEVRYVARGNTIDWEQSCQEEVILFKNLVCLYWFGFPFKSIPDNFHLGNLVILEMQCSNLELTWEGTKNLTMLKVLDLSESHSLTQRPDFSRLRNLESLNLNRCPSLVEIHESIHCLKKLVELRLRVCISLRNLPRGINKLESLEVLDVSYCCKLENLPKGFGELKRLKKLEMSNCKLIDDGIASDLGELSSLESLNLSFTKFKCLPMLPSSLCSLNVSFCPYLERLPYLSNLKQLRELDLVACSKVTEIEGLGGLRSATMINLSDCIKLETSVKKRIFQDICEEFGGDKICDIFLPGNEIPDWFAFQTDNCQVIAQPHNMEMQPQQKGLIICTTFEPLSGFINASTAADLVEVFISSRNSTWKHAQKRLHNSDGQMITWAIKIPNSVWKSIAAQCQYEYGDTLTVSAYRIGAHAVRHSAVQIGFHFF